MGFCAVSACQIEQAGREPDSMESGQLWKWRVPCNPVARLSMRPHVEGQDQTCGMSYTHVISTTINCQWHEGAAGMSFRLSTRSYL